MTSSGAGGAAKEDDSMSAREREMGEGLGVLLKNNWGGLRRKTPGAGTKATDTKQQN